MLDAKIAQAEHEKIEDMIPKQVPMQCKLWVAECKQWVGEADVILADKEIPEKFNEFKAQSQQFKKEASPHAVKLQHFIDEALDEIGYYIENKEDNTWEVLEDMSKEEE